MQLDRRINGTTKLTGLIGNPVEHTVSPELHNSLFHYLGINGIYVPLRVPAGGLKDAVKGLKASGFTGFNVTIPYKKDIIECVDEVSEEVKLLGTANTVKINEGRLFAYNTDAEGFVRAFSEQTGTGFKQKSVCVLGAGGTAKTLTMKIAMEGAAKLCIINRTGEKAAELAEEVNRVQGKSGMPKIIAAASDTAEALEMLSSCDIIVNTTSAGMHPDIERSPIQQNFVFHSRQMVYDVIYNPTQTRLLAQAKSSGCKTFNGAGMLFYQGVRAFEIFLDTVIPEKISSCLSTEFLKFLGA